MFDFFKNFVIILALMGCRNPDPCKGCLKMEFESSSFLESLKGEWEGYAVTTPIGKVSYDLNFKTIEKNKIKGTSYTNGRAIHTWVFTTGVEGQHFLDFHSTFGDSWAKGLCATQVDATKGYLFSNGNPSYLKLWFNPITKDEIEIEILLRDKPHVSIAVSKVIF